MKVLTLGGATYDIFLQYDNAETVMIDERCFLLLQEGRKVEVDHLQYYSGGGATNAAVSFARLGCDASSVFKVGDDCQGRFIVNQVREQGVTVHASSAMQEPTSCSIIIPCASGNRTILLYRGANTLLQSADVPDSLFADARCLYITSLSGSSAALLPDIAKRAQQSGVIVAVNPGSSQLEQDVDSFIQSLTSIAILILNLHEAHVCMQALTSTHTPCTYSVFKNNALQDFCERIPGADTSFSLLQFFTTVHALGPTVVVVTNGVHGVYVSSGQQLFFHPSVPAQQVSTVGAGDAFGSAFIAQHVIKKRPLEEAIIAGVCNSASVIKHVDAKTGLLTSEDIKKEYVRIGDSLLQIFSYA